MEWRNALGRLARDEEPGVIRLSWAPVRHQLPGPTAALQRQNFCGCARESVFNTARRGGLLSDLVQALHFTKQESEPGQCGSVVER